jgi:hypothetical protein
MSDRYDDGLDDEATRPRGGGATQVGAGTQAGTATRVGAPPRSRARDDDTPQRDLPSRLLVPVRWMTIPLFAAFVFAICGLLGFVAARVIAKSNMDIVLRAFATEGGVDSTIFGVVPALFAMMFALVLYQNAEQRITTVGQSLSRAILVALLTWIAFSALATWVWSPADYVGYFSSVLLVAGLLGGGPMLGSALLAGAIVGWLIKQRRLGWIMND